VWLVRVVSASKYASKNLKESCQTKDVKEVCYHGFAPYEIKKGKTLPTGDVLPLVG